MEKTMRVDPRAGALVRACAVVSVLTIGVTLSTTAALANGSDLTFQQASNRKALPIFDFRKPSILVAVVPHQVARVQSPVAAQGEQKAATVASAAVPEKGHVPTTASNAVTSQAAAGSSPSSATASAAATTPTPAADVDRGAVVPTLGGETGTIAVLVSGGACGMFMIAGLVALRRRRGAPAASVAPTEAMRTVAPHPHRNHRLAIVALRAQGAAKKKTSGRDGGQNEARIALSTGGYCDA